MNKITKFFGIDVSKEVFDVTTDQGNHFQFTNNAEGHEKLSDLLDESCQCVMEATGSYHQSLASWIFAKGHAVSVVNPLVIKRFAQMRLRLAKTDSKMIQRYGESEGPALWNPPQEFVSQAFEINGLVSLLIRQRTALKNKLHSVSQKPGNFSIVTKAITKEVQQLDRQVASLESSMEQLIRSHQGELFVNLCSIPGIGKKTAMFLIVVTNGFANFENSKQLSAYLGLAPTIRRSGSSVRGQSRISKTGNGAIRNLLFMCSFTACEKK